MDRSNNSSPTEVVKLERDPQRETQYVKQIVKTRGEGLSDLLSMKRDFEKYQSKVRWMINRYWLTVSSYDQTDKMGKRMGDLEESVSLIRNLNLDLMVTPERLEDKVHLL